MLIKYENYKSATELIENKKLDLNETLLEYLRTTEKGKMSKSHVRWILRNSEGDLNETLCIELLKEEDLTWIWKMLIQEREQNKLSIYSIELIVVKGRLDLIKYFYEQTGLKYISTLVYMIAFINLKPEIVKWIDNVCYINKTENKEKWENMKDKAIENIQTYIDAKKLIELEESQFM